MNYIQLAVTKPYFINILKNYNIVSFRFNTESIFIEFLDVNDLKVEDINALGSDDFNIFYHDGNVIEIY